MAESTIHMEHDATALAREGWRLACEGHVDAAALHYSEALKLEPQRADFHYAYGRLLRSRGDNDAALASYAEALRLRPDYADALISYGIACRHAGRAAEALDALQRAARLEAAPPEAFLNLAQSLESLGRTDEAEAGYAHAAALLERQARALPGRADLPVAFAHALRRAGRLQLKPEQVRELLERAGQIAPRDYEVQILLGDVRQAADDFAGARAAFSAALALDPTHAEAYSRLGILADEQGDFAVALEHARAALERAPDAPASHRNVGA